jgi:hypothetical protein
LSKADTILGIDGISYAGYTNPIEWDIGRRSRLPILRDAVREAIIYKVCERIVRPCRTDERSRHNRIPSDELEDACAVVGHIIPRLE